MTPQEEKKNELKRLFYTNWTSYEIQNYLNISQNEYNNLLAQVKKELGLKTSYKRIPSRNNQYKDGRYYIAKTISETDFEIMSYAPTKKIAEDLLYYYDMEKQDDTITFFINQATEEHMLDLIEQDYYNGQSWNTLMIKYKLSYHTFYKLLNKVKKRKNITNSRTGSNTRYIYKFANHYTIRKMYDGKQREYGVYEDLDIAMKIRDYLEENGWDYDNWNKNRMEIVEEITE